MHAYITTISMLAVVVNVTCNVPQLVAMLRTHTSSGQSCLGWALALAANSALAYVNWFGYHSPVLAIGNVLSLSACLTAIGLVRLYRQGPAVEPPLPASPMPLADSVIDMHTQEFVVLRDVVLAEHRRRTGEPELATA
jgi:hypothetical protein